MKLSFRLACILVAGMSIVTLFISNHEISEQERQLREELEQRTAVLAANLQLSLEPVLQAGSKESLQAAVDSFATTGRIAGVAVYNALGQTLGISAAIRDASNATRPQALYADVLQAGAPGRFVNLGERPIYAYFLRLRSPSDGGDYLTVFHDASYIETRRRHLWHETAWHLMLQTMFIISATFIVIRWRVVTPLARTTQWLKEFRAGKVSPRPQLPDDEFFVPLSHEVANLTQSLAEARGSAQQEARLRENGDSLWTAERLRASMVTKLHGNPVFVVSNREPYEHIRRGKEIDVVVPASGLVTALEPVLRACRGTWIAYGSGSADRETVLDGDRVAVPPDHPEYSLRRVWLTQEEFDGYYLGFANEGLWPLCHIAHARPSFNPKDWLQYEAVNKKFADVLIEEIGEAKEPIILIQDYHFALLPKMVKDRCPNARVAIFWHIPWTNPEAFGICPWQRQLMEGMLGADLVGFHTQSHCNNFLETAERVLECQLDWERFAVNRRGRVTVVTPHPISVAFPKMLVDAGTAAAPMASKAEIFNTVGVDAAYLGVGVDRIDYTKGILERLRGIEAFLDRTPLYRGLFTFVQIGAPSRTKIARYRDFFVEVQEECNRINARFETKTWKPIVLLARHHSQLEIEPYYKAADFCLVSSLHDGMNLVAKEFVASRDDEDGVLILSRFAGASRELRDALIVNPYDTQQIAESIATALQMPVAERRARMRRMRRVIRERNVYRWAAELLGALSEVRTEAGECIGPQHLNTQNSVIHELVH
jgi:trehalose-6-phosphate synthase